MSGNDNVLFCWWWCNLLESVQMFCTQGERGECGTPGIKGDSVWPLYKHHTMSLVFTPPWSQSISTFLFLLFIYLFTLSNASGSCWFGWNEGAARSAGQCFSYLFRWSMTVQVGVSATSFNQNTKILNNKTIIFFFLMLSIWQILLKHRMRLK